MQELANELSELELGLEGLEPMPDASLLTLATLIYCSLAFVGVFLRQQDEVGLRSPTAALPAHQHRHSSTGRSATHRST